MAEQFNPFTARIETVEQELLDLRASETELAADLAWNDGFDVGAAAEASKSASAAVAELDRQLAEIRTAMDEQKRRVKVALPVSEMGLNPLHWFSNVRAEAASEVREGNKEFAKLKAQKTKLVEGRDSLQQREQDARDSLERHAAFNRPAALSDLAELQPTIEKRDEDVESLRARAASIDKALEPILKEYTAKQRRVRDLEADLEIADGYQRDLGRARDGRERREIHEKCEREFDTGSPSQVAVRIHRELPALKRDVAKFERRLRDMVRKESIDARELVIDGSNLLYEGDSVSGLFALRALCEELVTAYKLTVIFDASALTKLGLPSEEALRSQMSGIEVQIMSSIRPADETILDTAKDPGVYVISNDRFVEFLDKPAVSEGRIIQHQIVRDRVMLHDLNIDIAFSREK